MPTWLNRKKALVTFGGRLILIIIFFVLVLAGHYLLRADSFPVKQVVITGKLNKISNEQLHYVAQHKIAGYNVLTLDLNQAQAEFQSLAWVKEADVKRLWPDRLEVSIQERTPVARWATGGLVDDQGVWFDANTNDVLPIFEGPKGVEKQLVQMYVQLKPVVAKMGERIKLLQLSDRNAWQLELESGPTIKLGRKEPLLKLQRANLVWKAYLKDPGFNIDYVDMRYSDGFALKLKKSAVQD